MRNAVARQSSLKEARSVSVGLVVRTGYEQLRERHVPNGQTDQNLPEEHHCMTYVPTGDQADKTVEKQSMQANHHYAGGHHDSGPGLLQLVAVNPGQVGHQPQRFAAALDSDGGAATVENGAGFFSKCRGA